MAIFDKSNSINTNSRNAILSANKISLKMEELNNEINYEFSKKLNLVLEFMLAIQ